MLSLIVSPNSDRPLTEQIVAGIKQQIDDRHVRAGTKLPSIRDFAETYRVSRFTVVEAYDRLVALGYLQSRPGAGFYSAEPFASASAHPEPSDNHKRNEQLVWLIRRLLEADENTTLAGGPWLPNSWLDEAGIRQSLNVLARKNGAYLLEYGNPFGYLPLREHLVLMLSGLGVGAHAGQILLTQGTSQALELVIRYLLKPGDAALVDDPGYYNMFGNLRLHGVTMLTVPRNPDGPDIASLETLAAAHRPKVYFTQSVMQNPTGTDMSPHVAFKVLQAAERYDFMVVEDDIFCDLQVRITPRLATLDQLNRVIYARSFSKTLSGSLRVGFLACRQELVNDLADIKMLTSITTSQFTERLIYLMLVDGHYRKYLSRLHERLGDARRNVLRVFERIGLEFFVEPTDGMFVWARFPHIDDSLPLAEASQRDGIMLAPGAVFRPHLERSPWMRFNVAACEEPRLQGWLQRIGSRRA
ncbi:MAG TPA: PLP-dependent aminotransferase family protein [Xanthobacteraceae bacterium]|jgi:DNA-binding transcriptional MocR family regulator|nr:PLP-dependent aminotransferase family protein [Xanthobacteraceae bacterium]